MRRPTGLNEIDVERSVRLMPNEFLSSIDFATPTMSRLGAPWPEVTP